MGQFRSETRQPLLVWFLQGSTQQGQSLHKGRITWWPGSREGWVNSVQAFFNFSENLGGHPLAYIPSQLRNGCWVLLIKIATLSSNATLGTKPLTHGPLRAPNSSPSLRSLTEWWGSIHMGKGEIGPSPTFYAQSSLS